MKVPEVRRRIGIGLDHMRKFDMVADRVVGRLHREEDKRMALNNRPSEVELDTETCLVIVDVVDRREGPMDRDRIAVVLSAGTCHIGHFLPVGQQSGDVVEHCRVPFSELVVQFAWEEDCTP